MKMKAYDSDPLPIKFREDQILMYAGNTDQMQFLDIGNLFMIEGISDEIIMKVIQMHLKGNEANALLSINNFASSMGPVVNGITVAQPSVQGRMNALKLALTKIPSEPSQLAKDALTKFKAIFEIFSAYQNRIVTMENPTIEAMQKGLETLGTGWKTVDVADAMAFVRDDANMVNVRGGTMRFFPSSEFSLKVYADNAIKAGIVKEKDRGRIKENIVFSFKEGAITREEIMMMDILANNEWKRGIYFSSPGGSALSKALFYAGAIKQNGMAFELNPLNESSQVAADEMYANLMTNYEFGKMSDPDVLTDYYARRHTSQYRLHFSTLAEYYANRIMQADNAKKQGQPYVDYLVNAGKAAEAIDAKFYIQNYDKLVAESKKKISALLRRSLDVMPAAIVLDNGEPSVGREKIKANGIEYPTYTDGTLVDYIELLYLADDDETADALGLELARQYESAVEFYLKSSPHIVLRTDNQDDLFAALNNYFKLVINSNDPEGNKKGKLASHSKAYMMQVYKVKLPTFYKTIEAYVVDKGESVRGGSTNPTAAKYLALKDYLDVLGGQYGMVERINSEDVQDMGGMDINQLLDQQMIQDSMQQ
jgi:hypothetical protein